MQNISKAGVGMYVSILLALLTFIGVDADEGMITEVVLSISQLVAFFTWVYGQIDRKDLHFGLFRNR